MTKLVTTLVVVVIGVAALAVATPKVLLLINDGLIPLVIVMALMIGLIRVVFYFTRNRW